MIPLFDLHCDTLLSLYKDNSSIEKNTHHISYEKASCFYPYIQVGAIWSDSSLSDKNAYNQFKNVVKYISKQNIKLATSSTLLKDRTFILAVEDARLLCNNVMRLDSIYRDGVRILGLNWCGINSLGGAWDTTSSLSSFGCEVVKRCCSLGIVLDISHSNEITSNKVIDLCKAFGGFVIASHSNSYEILHHRRNISDGLFLRLKEINSLIGISLVPYHLGITPVYIDHILKHIEHFLNLGGEDNICLGCDFDGVDSLPIGIDSIYDLNKLFEKIISTLGRALANKIFFENAHKFFSNALNS